MRRHSTPAITPRMYRHFAAMTLALTALLAFFANGENHQAIAAAAEAEAGPPPPQAARATPTPESEPEADSGSWGGETDVTFGQPMMRASARFGGWAAGSFDPRRAGPEDPTIADDEEADRAPEDESAAPSAAQIAAVAEASRLRSGSRGIE